MKFKRGQLCTCPDQYGELHFVTIEGFDKETQYYTVRCKPSTCWNDVREKELELMNSVDLI